MAISSNESRHRRIYLGILLLITIILGIASRKIHTPLGLVQKESGNVLWSMAAYFALAICMPRWRKSTVATVSLALAMGSELTQLCHAHWLDHFRTLPVLRMLLGSGFSWLDLTMYPIGSLVAWVIDCRIGNQAKA